MSVPAKKTPKSSVRSRRSHHALKKANLNNCSKCGHAVKPHTACLFCGTYKKREVVKIKAKKK